MSELTAVVEAWFPGQEGGAALAAILFADVNQSGKTARYARRQPGADYTEKVTSGEQGFDWLYGPASIK